MAEESKLDPTQAAVGKLLGSRDAVLDAAYASQLAYIMEAEKRAENKGEELPKDLTEKKALLLEKLDAQHVHTVYRPPCCAIVVIPRDKLKPSIIAYTGTNEFKDWRINLNALVPTPTGHGLAHRGWWSTLQGTGIVKELTQHVASDQPQDMPLPKDGVIVEAGKEVKKTFAEEVYHLAITSSAAGQDRIIVTGHSLGGALAMLAAADYSADEKKAKRMELITFSAPSVDSPLLGAPITQHLNDKLPDRVTGFAHENDLVNKIGSNMSAGLSVTFNDKGEMKGEYRTLAGALPRSITNPLENFLTLKDLGSNHDLDNLVEKLEAKVAQIEATPYRIAPEGGVVTPLQTPPKRQERSATRPQKPTYSK